MSEQSAPKRPLPSGVTPDWIKRIRWRTHCVRDTALDGTVSELLDVVQELRKRDDSAVLDLNALEAHFPFHAAQLGAFDEAWLESAPQRVVAFLSHTIHLLPITALQGFCLWLLRILYGAKTTTSVLGTTEVVAIDEAAAIKLVTFSKQRLTTSKRRKEGKRSGGLRNPEQRERNKRLVNAIKTWITKRRDLIRLDPRDDAVTLTERMRTQFSKELAEEIDESDLLRLIRKEIAIQSKALKSTLT